MSWAASLAVMFVSLMSTIAFGRWLDYRERLLADDDCDCGDDGDDDELDDEEPKAKSRAPSEGLRVH